MRCSGLRLELPYVEENRFLPGGAALIRKLAEPSWSSDGLTSTATNREPLGRAAVTRVKRTIPKCFWERKNYISCLAASAYTSGAPW